MFYVYKSRVIQVSDDACEHLLYIKFDIAT